MNWSLFLGLFFLHVVLQSLLIELHPSLEPSLLSISLTTEFCNSNLLFLGCAGVEVVLIPLPDQGALVVIQNSVEFGLFPDSQYSCYVVS